MVKKEIYLVSTFFFLLLMFSIYLGILTKDAIKRGDVEPLFPSPSDYKNIGVIFSLLIIGTITVILFLRIGVLFVKIIENVAAFFLLLTAFSYFFPLFLSIVFSVILILVSEIRKSYLLKNLIIFLSVSTAGALVGSSLSFKVAALLFFVLCAYDVLSVYFTKHMVYLAEKLVEKPSAFISIFPTRKVRRIYFGDKIKKINIIALGAGDYFLPAVVAVSLLEKGIVYSLMFSLFSAFSLLIFLSFLHMKKVRKPSPALPFLLPPVLVFYAISFYL